MKARTAASDLNEKVSGWRRLWPSALTALAIAFVAVRFLGATHDTLARTRGGACKALSPDPLPGFLQSGPTPDFQLPDAGGRNVSLSAQRGHPVLLNFWATWCPPCVDEVPSLEDLARKLDGTDLRMLAVSVDDDWGTIRRFFPKGSSIGVLLDTSHDIPKKFGTEKFPESFLIDAAGRVRYYFINKRDWSRPEAVACLESLRCAPAPVPAPAPQATPGARRRGIPPLPLLTLINFFNYVDRQVVYGMTPHIGEAFHLSNSKLGLLAWANLFVFAIASLISGPIADRVGPRRVIFTGILVWSIATIGSALSTSFPMLLFFRALVGVGEGAYGPSANTLLCADAPPEKRGRALGIYNVGMALGGTSGLVLGATLAPHFGWRGVFWIAGGPSILLALCSAFLSAPDRLERPKAARARSFLLSPTYLLALAGGILATFGASSLIFWIRTLVIEERHFSVTAGSGFMAVVGLVAGVGGVVVGGYAGDAFNRRRNGGHALTIGLSMLIGAPVGALALMVSGHAFFMVMTFSAAFLFSVYNGPSAAVVDELGPPQYGATLQAVFMFGLHVLGNAPAPSAVGAISDHFHTSIATSLQAANIAFALSGVFFLVVARRQRHAPAFH